MLETACFQIVRSKRVLGDHKWYRSDTWHMLLCYTPQVW